MTAAAAMTEAGRAHLQRLMASWGMLSDLSFADLLLFAPVDRVLEASRFVVLGQIRPTSTQTLHWEDLVGRVFDEADRPLIARSWRLGEIVDGEVMLPERDEHGRIQCIPVRDAGGDLLAVLSRESALSVRRSPGELERVYVEIFVRFAKMIVDGTFPFDVDDTGREGAPRVGDGVLVLDAGRRVEYASPNAVNALHRIGIHANPQGMRLDELGTDESSIVEAFATSEPVTVDVARDRTIAEEPTAEGNVIVLLRCVPLLEKGEVTGALVLMRDVSDLRRRDRLLLSKDTTIREIHHRVKNNLQTISSLLRLQGRRMGEGEGKLALAEAEQRIRSIALVHEILSRDVGEQVPFGEIARHLVRMAEESLPTPERPIRFELEGEAGEVSADVATPLAVVVTELIQNAVDHAFPHEGEHPADALVRIGLDNDGASLIVRVRDNGKGLPPGFSVDETESLGLSIVRHLVTSQLEGTISMRSDGGTLVELRVPVRL